MRKRPIFKLSALLLVLVWLVAPVWGKYTGHQTITVTNAAAVGINSTLLPASQAVITFEGGNVRIWFDGSNPSPTEGHLYLAGAQMILDKGDDIGNIRFIAVSASATVTVSLCH